MAQRRNQWIIGSEIQENDLPPLALRAGLASQRKNYPGSGRGAGHSGSGDAEGHHVGAAPEGPPVIVLDPETLVKRRRGAPLTPDPTRMEERARPI